MNGAGNRFLPSSGFAQNQHRGLARGHSLRLRQNTFQGSAFTNDLLKIEFRTDLVFQVKLFLCELVLQSCDFMVSTVILDCDCHSSCNLPEQDPVLACESIFLVAGQVQRSQGPFRADQRNRTVGTDAFA